MSDWVTVNEGGDAWDGKDPVQGIYQSKKSNVGPNDSNMYMLNDKNEMVGIWGSTVIDSKFEQIPIGSEVRVEFLGKAKSKKGIEYKDYKVQYKPSAMKEVKDVFEGAEEV